MCLSKHIPVYRSLLTSLEAHSSKIKTERSSTKEKGLVAGAFWNKGQSEGVGPRQRHLGLSIVMRDPQPWMVYKENPIKMDEVGVPLFQVTSI